MVKKSSAGPDRLTEEELERATAALQRLLAAGADGKVLRTRLFLLCLRMSQEQDRALQTKRDRWKSHSGAPEGMNWKQFQNWINSLIQLADEIDRVNNSPHYELARWFPDAIPGEEFGKRNLVSALPRLQTRRELARLPELLRLYSAFLERVSNAVRTEFYTSGRKPLINLVSMRDELVEYVKMATGNNPHSLRHLATLLELAYKHSGIDSESGINPDTLRRQLSRRKLRSQGAK